MRLKINPHSLISCQGSDSYSDQATPIMRTEGIFLPIRYGRMYIKGSERRYTLCMQNETKKRQEMEGKELMV